MRKPTTVFFARPTTTDGTEVRLRLVHRQTAMNVANFDDGPAGMIDVAEELAQHQEVMIVPVPIGRRPGTDAWAIPIMLTQQPDIDGDLAYYMHDDRDAPYFIKPENLAQASGLESASTRVDAAAAALNVTTADLVAAVASACLAFASTDETPEPEQPVIVWNNTYEALDAIEQALPARHVTDLGMRDELTLDELDTSIEIRAYPTNALWGGFTSRGVLESGDGIRRDGDSFVIVPAPLDPSPAEEIPL